MDIQKQRKGGKSMDLRRNFWTILLVALILMALLGCQAQRATQLPRSVPTNFNRQSLSEVVDQMDDRRFKVETLVARLQMVMRDNKKGREHGLSGAYVGDRIGNWRLQMRVGENLIADLAYRGDQVDVWLPRKEKFYRGRRSVLAQTGSSELALLARTGNVSDLFFPRAWTQGATERRVRIDGGREFVNVIAKAGLFNRTVMSVLISDANPVADQVTVFKTSGSMLGHVMYNDYRFPAPRAGDPDPTQPTVPYPGRIMLVGADGQRSLQLDVEELLVNTPVPLTRFEIEVSEGQRILNMEETLAAGNSLWE